MLRFSDFRIVILAVGTAALCFSSPASPQIVSPSDRSNLGINLVIRVTDGNNSGIAADVSLQESGMPDRTSSTDEHGDCFFHQLPAGDYVLIVSIHGRERWRQDLVLGANEGTHSELIRFPRLKDADPGQVSAMDLNVPRRASDRYRAAVSDAHNGKWRAAEANFRAAISECPTYARAFNGLGVVLEMQARRVEAENAFRKAIALDNKFGEAHLNFGHLLVVLNRPLEAVIELQDVLSTDPRNKEAVTLLGDTYFALHDDESAMRLLDYADARSIPHDPEFHFDLAKLLEGSQTHDLAIKQYRQHLAEAPSGAHGEDARRYLLATSKP